MMRTLGHPPEHMVVEFDPAVNGAYLRIRVGIVTRTEAIGDTVNIDRDDAGTILGVEVLGPTAPVLCGRPQCPECS